jgi:alpha-glucosidase
MTTAAAPARISAASADTSDSITARQAEVMTKLLSKLICAFQRGPGYQLPAALALVAAALLVPTCARGETVTIASPNGQVEFKLEATGSRLTHQLSFGKHAVIEPSPLSISADDKKITEGVEIGATKRYELNETYPWRGVHSRATNHCHGATISLKHSPTGIAYTIDVRVFDDGVGFRYIIPGGATPRVPDEESVFTLPEGSTTWYHDLEGHYEATYHQKSAAEVTEDQWVAPPMTFKLPTNAGYASITEAALVNYSGMALHASGNRRFSTVLGHKHPASYPFRLRYPEDVERLTTPAAVAGIITSPWRVVLVSKDLNGLVNSDIVHNLCPPADPKLFPEGLATRWVKPGRAVWKYLDGGANTFEEMKEFSRMAGELGFEYHVIEGFWSRWTDEQLKELVNYSRERGVGLFLWRHSKQLRTDEAREEFFKKLHDAGVVGAKIDFFDHEHKEVVDLYTSLLATAAKYRIMVNFHGANKPTGEPRTWPNELLREGVRGMESSRLQARALHDATLPFTRYLAGHGDYTPVHFGARRGDTTWAHQIATAAVFDEPLLTYGAHPKNLLSNPGLPMIKAIPPAWDETIVLPQSEIGRLAAFARRSGQIWFLAILNGPDGKTVKVPLTFLSPGDYETLIVRDHETDPAAVKVEQGKARSGETLTIDLASGGGFVTRFSKP